MRSLNSLYFWGLIDYFSKLVLLFYFAFDIVGYILIVCTASNLDYLISRCWLLGILPKKARHILYLIYLSRAIRVLYDNHWIFLLIFRLMIYFGEFGRIRSSLSVLSVSWCNKQQVIFQFLLYRSHSLFAFIAFSGTFLRSLSSILRERVAQTTFHLNSLISLFLKPKALALGTISFIDLETTNLVTFFCHLLVITVLYRHRFSLLLLKWSPRIL